MRYAVLSLSSLVSIVSMGQAGSLDLSFGSSDLGNGLGDGPGGSFVEVKATVKRPDDRLILAGTFSYYNGSPVGRIVQIDTDGSLDPSFDTGIGFNAEVTHLALQSDGKVLVAGAFDSFNGTPCQRLVRLEPDGSLDDGFQVGTGPAGEILSLMILTDGGILCAGTFTQFNGVVRHRLVRLLPDGSVDETFLSGSLATAFPGLINALLVQPDGKIITAGNFTEVGGVTRHGIARLFPDGSLDPDFDVGVDVWMNARTLALQSSGKLLVGGGMNMAIQNNQPMIHGIGRLNENGTLDQTFGSFGEGISGPPLSPFVHAIEVLDDGTILMAGTFSAYLGAARTNIMRLDHEGVPDLSFDPGERCAFHILSMALLSSGSVHVAGTSSMNKVLANGADDPSFNPGTGLAGRYANALAILPHPSGGCYVAGYFRRTGGEEITHLARLYEDGTVHPGFPANTLFAPFSSNTVHALAWHGDDHIYVGGQFSTIGDSPAHGIARITSDGDLDPNFSVSGIDPLTTVRSIAIQDDGGLLLGGNIQVEGTQYAVGLVRLTPEGQVDPSIQNGPEFSGQVMNVHVLPDGRIWFVGHFNGFMGQATGSIARILPGGSLDPTFMPGSGSNDMIITSGLQADGKLVIAGTFTEFNGIELSRIARLDTNGAVDLSFDIGTGFNGIVSALYIAADGKIVVAGGFTTYDGSPCATLVRLNIDGTLDSTFDAGDADEHYEPGLYMGIHAIAAEPGGRLLIGGGFTAYDGIGRNRIARIHMSDPLDIAEGYIPSGLVFPNPTPGSFQMTAPFPVKLVHALDLAGRSVRATIIRNNERTWTIDLTGHPPGIYAVTLIGELQTITDRVVIVGPD